MFPDRTTRARITREVERFDPQIPIARADTPPASWYTDAGFHQLEARAVHARNWQVIGRIAQLAQPGAYLSGTLGPIQWLVTRDETGQIRAFHNVCRHKAALVMEGGGCAEQLRCPYHGWTYALDGTLRSAPRLGGIEGFDRSRLSLAPMAVEIWGPLVLINPDPQAEPFAPQVSALTQRLVRSGWQHLRHVHQRRYALACDWKVYVDNYLDGGYHVPILHPALCAGLEMSSYTTEIFGIYSIQSARTEAAEDRAQRLGSAALYAWVYPGLMINRYGPIMDINRVVPTTPGHCEVIFDFFFATDPAPEPGFIEQSIAASHQVQLEDEWICQRVQQGLGSGSYDRGRYAPGLEQGEHHFHSLLSQDYQLALL